MKVNLKYIIVFSILLAIEVFIALFVRDKIIRPFIGDILVIVLMYSFIRSIVQKTIKFLPVYLFLLAVFVEITQYFHLVDKLGLKDNKFMATVLGTSFDVKDILCYFIGSIILIFWERKLEPSLGRS
ncbi:DUF2809 domain-containing protein [Acetivibrio clariflavus]|uniref:DUF2809 domain-containing protein n=1 Tax=Acetivibrio clariflavus (strain DSM 19732 / NBRC 101661 / EBR45) TaxID=720554 RepID=G8LWY6_ACECE|nr:DUF2809 domain-containing protein [Acetivibrio clariflavus]AEV67638.1 Protein of unknown function (DUF2809) [Acetivibrio clariflavus DSM 19732]